MAIGLIRYGTIPEVARFELGAIEGLQRGSQVVIETHHGLQVGTFVERLRPVHHSDRDPDVTAPGECRPLLRTATEEDLADDRAGRESAAGEYQSWVGRIDSWGLELELIDLEWTLDRQKLILYVLNDRGPECTKLALQAAAAGLGSIEVQPVTAEGLVTQPTGGGGGGCGSCGSH